MGAGSFDTSYTRMYSSVICLVIRDANVVYYPDGIGCRALWFCYFCFGCRRFVLVFNLRLFLGFAYTIFDSCTTAI